MLAQGVQTNQYGPSFTVVGLTSSNTFYSLAVQWTNMGGVWVLSLVNPPALPVIPDGIPTNSSGAAIAGYYSIYDSSALAAGTTATWADLGPYGHNLTAAPGNAPTALANYAGGRSALAFSNAAFANTCYLTNLTYASPAGPSEIFLMLLDNNTAQASYSWQTLLAPAPGTNYGSQYIWINNGDYDLRAQMGGLPASSPAPLPTNNWIVVDCVFNSAGNGAVYTNNVLYQGNLSMGTAHTPPIFNSEANHSMVWYAFLGVYTNVLSSADRTNVYGYLTNRYLCQHRSRR